MAIWTVYLGLTNDLSTDIMPPHWFCSHLGHAQVILLNNINFCSIVSEFNDLFKTINGGQRWTVIAVNKI